MNIIELEKKGCFDFFYNEVSLKDNTFGLIRDNSSDDMRYCCSIASVGFGLCALAAGAKEGYISRKDGEDRCFGTLWTLLYRVPSVHGFFYHFMDMDTGSPVWNKEISIIDTSIAVMGALTAGGYFAGRCAELADQIYRRVDWPFYLDPVREVFYMGYNDQGGFGAWDMYAEQLMIYFLSVASPTHPVPPSVYGKFRRDIGSYGGKEFIYTPLGSIFPYQFSHAFLDFRGKLDPVGVDWFANSVEASRANQRYCADQRENYHTLHENSWGLTACQTPRGYDGDQGALPAVLHHVDGTVPPCGSIGSIVFTPKESVEAMEYFYNEHKERLWGKYGFHDSYNLDVKPDWYCDFEIGIDKGISLMMLMNHTGDFFWNIMNKNPYIQEAFRLLGFRDMKR